MKKLVSDYADFVVKFIDGLSEKCSFWFKRAETNHFLLLPAVLFSFAGLIICLLIALVFHVLSIIRLALIWARLSD